MTYPHVIFEQCWPATIDRLKTLVRPFEAWIFADQATRYQAEQELAKRGVKAQLHCAYKPLVHYFLEDAPLNETIETITIHYPAHPTDANSRRFLLEAYPLAGILNQYSVTFHAKSAADNLYEIVFCHHSGEIQVEHVFAPNRLHQDHTQSQIYSPCGWLKYSDQEQQVLQTEIEQLFEQLIAQLHAWPWPEQEPYFETLRVQIDVPFTDHPLDWGEEVISLAESLHEDVYFSLLELFTLRSGRKLGSRQLQPGQIIPQVRQKSGPWRLRVTLENYHPHHFLPSDPLVDNALESTPEPLTPPQITTCFEKLTQQLGGQPYKAQSRHQLPIPAALFTGSQPGIVITAAQHANETTGTIGLLRALPKLQTYHHALGIIPMHNPEGAHLFHQLREDNPLHMTHAARYTALGNDLQDQLPSDTYEKAIRDRLIENTSACVHLNLHGYPSHEWTRPLTGYSPRGFELWSIPKGFFLIIRHRAGLETIARHYLEAITKTLAHIGPLVHFNQQQLQCYHKHAGEIPFELINGFACDISERTSLHVPFELITEYPDETSAGKDFILGHETQRAFLLAAFAHLSIINNLPQTIER